MSLDIRGLVGATAWLDTHEHLPEEATRLAPPIAGSGMHPCEGWAYLLWHYALDDLVSAGLSNEERQVFVSPDAGPLEKWDAIAPAYERTRHTAYLRAARDSIRLLFDLELSRQTVEEVDRRQADLRRPGFYREVLARAGVSACQVNSLEATFAESADPDILQQDIGLTDFVRPTPERRAEWEALTGRTVESLDDLIATLTEVVTQVRDRAVAMKLGIAYARPLAVATRPPRVAGLTFSAWLAGGDVPVADARAIEDAVMAAGLALATDLRLPVKVHTGLHVGTGSMPLRSVRDNVADVTDLARRYGTDFVLMHIGYPYEGEVIAAAKHFPNVVADLCWAWIIDPVAARSFVKRFLVAAPASKLLCFGGDYIPVENIVGHAHLARLELARALGELRDEGYLDDRAVAELVPQLMHGNAERVFRLDRATALVGVGG
jgi:uncharacterized protein